MKALCVGEEDRITRCPADKYRNIHCALGVNLRRVDDDDDDDDDDGVCVCVCVCVLDAASHLSWKL